MTTPVRVFVATLSCAGAVAVSLLAGCSDSSEAESLGRVQAWIPAGAVRAYPLIGPEDLPRAVGVRVAAGQREGLVPIGDPETAGRRWWAGWPSHGARVSQAVLVKTGEGHFYRGEYVWRDDLIVEGCDKSPSLCARFDDMHAVDVEEAKAMLMHAPQFTPSLFTQFFGVAPAVGARA